MGQPKVEVCETKSKQDSVSNVDGKYYPLRLAPQTTFPEYVERSFNQLNDRLKQAGVALPSKSGRNNIISVMHKEVGNKDDVTLCVVSRNKNLILLLEAWRHRQPEVVAAGAGQHERGLCPVLPCIAKAP